MGVVRLGRVIGTDVAKWDVLEPWGGRGRTRILQPQAGSRERSSRSGRVPLSSGSDSPNWNVPWKLAVSCGTEPPSYSKPGPTVMWARSRTHTGWTGLDMPASSAAGFDPERRTVPVTHLEGRPSVPRGPTVVTLSLVTDSILPGGAPAQH